jgi:predicted PurR-regulated permease PerM
MIESYKQGFKNFGHLINFTNYKTSEIILKALFMPIILPIFLFFFVAAAGFFTVERLLAPLFKYFLSFQMKMFQKRGTSATWPRRLYGLLTFFVSIIAIPFLIVYYGAMMLKGLSKLMMKSLIERVDFSVQYNKATLTTLDDNQKAQSPFASMLNDARQAQGFGKALEDYINTHPELADDADISDADYVDEVDDSSK